MDVLLVIHPAEESGYWAEIPDFEGCFVQGETIEDVLDDAPRAIASHVEAMRAEGRTVPASRRVVLATVSAPILDPD